MVPALQGMAAAGEAHLLALTVDVVVAGNAEYKRLRHAGGGADGVEESARQLVVLGLARVGDVARREDEVRARPFPALAGDCLAHGPEHHILRPRIAVAQMKIRDMEPGDGTHGRSPLFDFPKILRKTWRDKLPP